MDRKSFNIARTMVSVASLVAILAILAFHFSVPVRGGDPNYNGVPVSTLDSDKVEGLLWADAAIQAHQPLNPDFSYSYAIPFGANLLFIPFIRFLGVRLLSNQLGMLSFSLIFLIVGAYFLRTLVNTRAGVLAGVAVLFLAFRSSMGVNLLHHILFYQLGFIALLGILGALFAGIGKDRLTASSALCLFLFSAFGAANGMVTISLSVAPVAIALAFVHFRRDDGDRHLPLHRLLPPICAGLAIGFAAYKLAMHGISESPYMDNVSCYKFSSKDTWFANMLAVPNEWMKLFIAFPTKGVDIFSVSAFDIFFGLAMSVIVGMIPLHFILRYRESDVKDRILLLADAGVWAVCLLQFVFLRGALDRLLYNALLMNYLLLAVAVARASTCGLENGRLRNWVPPVLLAFWCVRFAVAAPWKIDSPLIRELESRQLRYGYASFWHANGNTVLSRDRIRVAPISIFGDGKIAPENYQSGQSWYEVPNILGDGFVILDENEWNRLQDVPNNMLLTLPKDRFEVNDLHVLVYSSLRLQKMLSGKVFSYNMKNRNWQKGCSTASDGRHIPYGAVSFGPYITLERGQSCSVLVRGKNLGKATLSLRGKDEDGNKVGLEHEYSLRTDTKLCFSIVADTDLEKVEVIIRNMDENADVVVSSADFDAS